MTATKIIVPSLFLLLLSSCTTFIKNNAHSKALELEEIYKIVALTKSRVGKKGKPCSDAVGVIKIQNHNVVGKATDSIGRRFIISGTTVKGNVSGGFALTNHLAVKFSGNINKSGDANGTWKDMFGCHGEWKAQRVLKRKIQKKSNNIKT